MANVDKSVNKNGISIYVDYSKAFISLLENNTITHMVKKKPSVINIMFQCNS